MTEVRDAEYGLNGIEGFSHVQPKDSQDSKLRKFLFDTLEGSLDLLQHTPDAAQCNIVFEKLGASGGLRHGHYMPEDERKEEQEILRKIRFAYRGMQEGVF